VEIPNDVECTGAGNGALVICYERDASLSV